MINKSDLQSKFKHFGILDENDESEKNYARLRIKFGIKLALNKLLLNVNWPVPLFYHILMQTNITKLIEAHFKHSNYKALVLVPIKNNQCPR
ncbi:hypothetical protein Mucpa_1664 [Mucilaginibacter paludis DSM 18603]|uniref:Uncharacterized protein n=1 Tax=Mucilaginibacter paludis DSM 18603 TaxID=714943 RepID=H1Y6H7_9SPHI|nr:hypothetical protein Mucpa_1664 [Mucilaginibacter paludis DSM 18603]